VHELARVVSLCRVFVHTGENYWAVMRLKTNRPGIVMKTFFPRGTSVKIGDPIAIIGADGESIPYGKAYSILEIVKVKREKKKR
jgi:pyruvate/2-oxoglutarate dehydrogenase complex dihydrolipoamide acyltransferase (E2) component